MNIKLEDLRVKEGRLVKYELNKDIIISALKQENYAISDTLDTADYFLNLLDNIDAINEVLGYKKDLIKKVSSQDKMSLESAWIAIDDSKLVLRRFKSSGTLRQILEVNINAVSTTAYKFLKSNEEAEKYLDELVENHQLEDTDLKFHENVSEDEKEIANEYAKQHKIVKAYVKKWEKADKKRLYFNKNFDSIGMIEL